MRTLLATLCLSAALVGQGKILLSGDEALALAFPGCEFERVVETLSPAQKERATELCGEEVERALVYTYLARKKGDETGELVGTAYFDRHRVRTLKEIVMVAVDLKSRVKHVELLAFGEPMDYVPGRGFYDQFTGLRLCSDLNLRSSIHNVTGATLTCRSTTDCARRVLAIHQVLEEERAAEEAEKAEKQPAEKPAGEVAERKVAERKVADDKAEARPGKDGPTEKQPTPKSDAEPEPAKPGPAAG